MKIDKAFLQGQMATFQDQVRALEADLNATRGALQLCDHLLSVLKMKKPPKEEETPPEGEPSQ